MENLDSTRIPCWLVAMMLVSALSVFVVFVFGLCLSSKSAGDARNVR